MHVRFTMVAGIVDVEGYILKDIIFPSLYLNINKKIPRLSDPFFVRERDMISAILKIVVGASLAL
jgi:hypothetical protein